MCKILGVSDKIGRLCQLYILYFLRFAYISAVIVRPAEFKAVRFKIFFENLLLTLFAGVLGLALSYTATFLLNGFLFNNSTNAYLSGETALTPGMLLSPWAFLAAFGFCLLMNILSAGIPAWRASRMNITDAINQR